MARPRQTEIKIEELDERQAHEQLRKTYRDPDAAIKYFSTYIAQREQALKQFDAEVNKDGALAERFAKDPLGVLNERRLIGPLDRLDLVDLVNPFHPLPWPIPHCRVICRFECRPEIHWVCISIFGFRICWPRFHIHCRWVCRIVCF